MTAEKKHADGDLPAARRNLDDAISALIDPKPETRHVDDPDNPDGEGTTRIEWLDALYVQLAEAIPGEKKHRPNPKGKSLGIP